MSGYVAAQKNLTRPTWLFSMRQQVGKKKTLPTLHKSLSCARVQYSQELKRLAKS
ncbi:hypothetical protein QUF54_07640 [Candidatus Marithioploca araucensis]|uniref:Uncharacterized protein n=1 Tax=Candidatus Marithioploca araucensis TaxID=70273 RepID=A0ABT7VUD6_9GAMM|nr:hypothetical protein [Candidatus Marithioploca araucensis]